VLPTDVAAVVRADVAKAVATAVDATPYASVQALNESKEQPAKVTLPAVFSSLAAARQADAEGGGGDGLGGEQRCRFLL